MSEFNNRIDAQRRILRLVNASRDFKEELFGLSSGALERWARVNDYDEHNPLLVLLKQAAAKLSFLANKSQEQITDEYRSLSDEVASLTEQIRVAASNFSF
ncbi:MAG: hypothetical protein ABL891_00740 [Burkholderiales bacterium]